MGILKTDWERHSPPLELNLPLIQEAVGPHLPHQIVGYELLLDGAANTHYKLLLKGHEKPVVLRIYTYSPQAFYRERLVLDTLPMALPHPRILAQDGTCTAIPYPFTVLTWMSGIKFRDFLLQSLGDASLPRLSYEVGKCIGHMQSLPFPSNDTPGTCREASSYILPSRTSKEMAFQMLYHPAVRQALQKTLLRRTEALFNRYEKFFPASEEANLTHGDLDPTNIIVEKVQGKWRLQGIIDWEFSFSGHYLLDLGTMLCDAHAFPKSYKRNLVAGVKSVYQNFPHNWEGISHLLVLSWCLHVLSDVSPLLRPMVYSDIMRWLKKQIMWLEENGIK